MELRVTNEEQTAIIKVSGDVNIKTAPILARKAQDQMVNGNKRLILDLAEVHYMDSSGVGVLVTGMKQAAAKKIAFGLAEVNERVCSVLELTRLTTLFNIFPDVDAAKKQL